VGFIFTLQFLYGKLAEDVYKPAFGIYRRHLKRLGGYSLCFPT
jgi:hypothetical protein